MVRNVLLLAGVAALLITSAARAVSETVPEQLDRAQKAMQTRLDEMEKEKPPGGKHAGAKRHELNNGKNALARAVGRLQEARNTINAGNEDAAAGMLTGIENNGQVPQDAKNALDAVVVTLRKDVDEKKKDFDNKADDVLKRAGATVLKAGEPKELDASLQELSRTSDQAKAGFGADKRLDFRLYTAISLIKHWQEYLFARGRNDEVSVSAALRQISSDNDGCALIPRSEVLTRMPEKKTDPAIQPYIIIPAEPDAPPPDTPRPSTAPDAI